MNQLVEKPKRIYGERSDFSEKALFQELGEPYIKYREKWLQASRREIITDFPLYLQIEHLGKCNLRCPTCIHGYSDLSKNYKNNFEPLDIELYKKVLNEAKKYNCPSISFHNNDEPLLLNDLEERIRLAKESGFIDLIITTNATLITKEKANNLLNSGITKLNFSVDCWDKNDYEKTRVGGNFEKVIGNIRYFLEEKNKKGLRLPITRATSVLTRNTYKDMEKFRNFWQKEIGVDMVEFQNFQALKNHSENLKPKNAEIDKEFICNGPWQQVVIRPNGDVLPCCSFYGTGLVLGNIKNDSIYDLWHSDKMKKIREQLSVNNFNFSPICEACSQNFYVGK